MRLTYVPKLSAVVLIAAAAAVAQNVVVPNTTLALEKSRNTSVSQYFTGMSNGNPPPANVSKQDLHALLYPGSTTRIFPIS
ncbi:MAG: hypothetical protein NVS9B15_22940 [Acidobacteriaceae bacterium]